MRKAKLTKSPQRLSISYEEGWAFLGEVGTLLQKKQPNFDARNYGFKKLTPLVKSIGQIEIGSRKNPKGNGNLIYVRTMV